MSPDEFEAAVPLCGGRSSFQKKACEYGRVEAIPPSRTRLNDVCIQLKIVYKITIVRIVFVIHYKLRCLTSGQSRRRRDDTIYVRHLNVELGPAKLEF
jgi:hypothetical protein